MLPSPVLCVPPAAPTAALLFEDALGDLGEGGNALGVALLRLYEGIAAGAGQLEIGEGQFDVLAAVLFDSSGRAGIAAAAVPYRPRRPPGPARAAGQPGQAAARGAAARGAVRRWTSIAPAVCARPSRRPPSRPDTPA